MVEITGVFDNEKCDHCGELGATGNVVIEFYRVSESDDIHTISIHQSCLSTILANYGTGIPLPPHPSKV